MSEDLIQHLKDLLLFADLDDEQIKTITGLVELESFPEGKVILRQGEESTKFYIIESGRVLVTVHDPAGVEAALTELSAGEFFGEVGPLEARPRNATISTLTNTSLYSLTENNFKLLLQRFPKIEEKITKKAVVRTGGGQERFPWQLEDEVTLLVSRRHWLALVRTIPVMLFALLACIVLVFAVFNFLANIGPLEWITSSLAIMFWVLLVAWFIVDWTNDYFIVTSLRAVHIERIAFVSETRTEVLIEAVQDVNIQRESILATWFNYGNIRIQTAGGGLRGITFTYLPNPEAAQQQILQQRMRLTTEAREEQRAARRYEIEKAITPPGAPPPPKPPAKPMIRPVPAKKPPPSLGERISGVAQLRIEQAGQIIWRKHWLFLVKQISRPFLLMVISIALLSFAPRLHFICGPLLWLAIVFSLVWFVWEWADWGNDLYILTPTNIIDIERLPLKLRESRREGGLEQIQDIEVVLPTFWSYIFNIGNVRIRTAAAEGDFTFDHVFDPRGVQRDIFHQVALHRRQRDLRERERQYAEMAEWFAAYSEVTGQIPVRQTGSS